MIKCKDVTLSFDGKKVFDDLNIQIRKGEHACIRGISGKGKSTFLKLLQGYVIPSSGSIEINGLLLNTENIKRIRKYMVWVPQNIHLPVQNGLELANMVNLKIQESEVDKLLNQLGLEHDIINKNFSKISGGQKQRVVIAICFALHKDIVLMDEPTASLDDESTSQIINTVKGFNGSTIVSASHNQLWVKSADKIYDL
ncbi:MAG: ATP-binding cassette domain-containing protein [Bacteroidales bacterium]